MSLGLIPGLAGTLYSISGPTTPQMEANLAMTPASKRLVPHRSQKPPASCMNNILGIKTVPGDKGAVA